MFENGQRPSVVLSILTGPYARVARHFPFGSYSIGSSADSDIVLDDDALSPLHAQFEFAESGVKIAAVGGDVVFARGQGKIGAGHDVPTRTLAWPVRLTMGQTQMKLKLDRGVHSGGRKLPFKYGPMIVGPALLIAVTLLASQLLSKTRFMTDIQPNIALDLPDALKQPSRTKEFSPLKQELPKIETAINDLRTQLAGVGLDSVDLRQENGIIVVSGALGPDAEPRWYDIEAWFDRRFGRFIPLDNRLVFDSPADDPDLIIRAVWAGPQPYIVAGDDQRYREGAYMPGGWTVDTIGPDAVTFRRQDQTFRFDLSN